MNLTRHIKLQVADGESQGEFIYMGKMRGPVSQDIWLRVVPNFEAHRSNSGGRIYH